MQAFSNIFEQFFSVQFVKFLSAILIAWKIARKRSFLFMQEYAEKFYKSKAWQKTRKAYLKSVGGLCETCLAKGIITPAVIVHHKIHISPENINNPNITLSFNNLEALCRDCHALEHPEIYRLKSKRYRVDEYGRVIQSKDTPLS